jgi:hypothetical protein
VIRVRAQVIATATNSTDTLTLKLLIGTTTVASTGAVDVANNDIGYFDALTIRSDTAAAPWSHPAPRDSARPARRPPSRSTSRAARSTRPPPAGVKVSATWSVANAGNSCRLDQLVVELLRQ